MTCKERKYEIVHTIWEISCTMSFPYSKSHIVWTVSFKMIYYKIGLLLYLESKTQYFLGTLFGFYWFWDIQWATSHFDSMTTYCSFCERLFMAFLQLNALVVLTHKIGTNSRRLLTKIPMRIYYFTVKV